MKESSLFNYLAFTLTASAIVFYSSYMAYNNAYLDTFGINISLIGVDIHQATYEGFILILSKSALSLAFLLTYSFFTLLFLLSKPSVKSALFSSGLSKFLHKIDFKHRISEKFQNREGKKSIEKYSVFFVSTLVIFIISVTIILPVILLSSFEQDGKIDSQDFLHQIQSNSEQSTALLADGTKVILMKCGSLNCLGYKTTKNTLIIFSKAKGEVIVTKEITLKN